MEEMEEMEVTIRKADKEMQNLGCEFFAHCPSCGEKAEICYDDYTTHTALLCWWGCGGKFFLEVECEEVEFTEKTKCMKILAVSNEQKDDETDFPSDNLFLPCNSYDLTKPETPYPNGFDLRHDGISLYIKAVDSLGTQHKIKLWGD